MERKQRGQSITVGQKEDEDIEKIIAMLDGFATSEASRLKVEVSDEYMEGEVKHSYHHGRCDIGSPWARGCAFDILEDD